ncbi:hypothetical protein BEP19_05525 [Ammoniphilus oxalaticus]|uniref:Type II secretion system protein GspF domain-containing protein n=1 Tax=Ammoniphilus oxalaticus TaxID=66863 RepID=A0A419SIU6_9BACL|nr:type II secretion system F family protein [Ammoniphilus oxalaticus]RKD23887.1 hypothetical protein BEP19_05525 [Ammoniphilus oxalaticus]
MLEFTYSGYNAQQKRIQGKIEARDKREAFRNLKQQGMLITHLNERKQTILTKDIEILTPGVKQRDFVVFCRQFATLLRAGVGIAEALQILVQQTDSKVLKKALEIVLEDVRSGSSLSVACQQQRKVFPVIFVSMARAGETSGSLDDMLDKLAGYFEKEHNVKGKIKSALFYPIAVGILSVLVSFFLMWKVVPQFVSVFQNVGLELPWITRFVLGVSEWVGLYWFLLLGLPVLIWAVLFLYGKNEKGRYQIDWVKLKLPIVGSLLIKSSLARFSRTFSTLYQAAVPVVPTLAILVDIVGNQVISQSLNRARDNLREGQPLAQPFRENSIFPPMVSQMIAIGEQTGNLDEVMGKVADYYEEEVDQMAERMRSLIEPIMLVVVSFIVGIIVLAVLLPMFALYEGMT